MSILLYNIAGTHAHTHVLIILADKLARSICKVISFRITKGFVNFQKYKVADLLNLIVVTT
jgi:hypothetical protein